MMRYVVRTILSFVVCLLVVLPSAAQSVPDLATYNAWLREAFAAAQRHDRLGLEEIADNLIATDAVRIGGPNSVSVDNQWLEYQLNQPTIDFEIIEHQLGGILDALAMPLGTTPADAQARLDAIMTNPPYAQRQQNTNNWTFFQNLFRAIERFFDGLFSSVSTPSISNPFSGDALLWIGIIFLVALVLYAVWRLRAIFVRDAKLKPVDWEEEIDAKEALDHAGEMASKGNYRDAMRYLYLSALLWLDEKQYLRYDRALTNREYLERIRDNAELSAKLRPIVDTFDRVWYGHNELTADDYAQYRRQIDTLRAET
jgi:hypothetical protein